MSEEYKLDKKQTDELFVMSKKIRDTYIDYSHLPGEYRIAYALVCARTMASEEGNKKLVKAIEDAQTFIDFKIFQEYIAVLKRVYKAVKGREYKG